jgi:hypothetical protein
MPKNRRNRRDYKPLASIEVGRIRVNIYTAGAYKQLLDRLVSGTAPRVEPEQVAEEIETADRKTLREEMRREIREIEEAKPRLPPASAVVVPPDAGGDLDDPSLPDFVRGNPWLRVLRSRVP